MAEIRHPKFCLDFPNDRTLQADMAFSGWYFPATEKPPTLRLRIDGKDLSQLQHGISRADVAQAFPEVDQAGQSGFQGTFSLNLADLPAEVDIEIVDESDTHGPRPLFKDTFSKYGQAQAPKPKAVPVPPNDLLARISGDPDPQNFLNSFESLRHEVLRYLAEAGVNFSNLDHILDLGCGVGRFLLAFRDSLNPGQQLRGCDVHRGCAEWCQDNIDFADVAHNGETPPLPYSARQFNMVYALSVFTHLKLDLQFLWVWELYRVLKPGGIAFLTLHGNSYFPTFYQSWRDGSTISGETISIGDGGLFAYLIMKSGDSGQGQIGVAAGHSPELVRDLFAPFQILKWVPQSTLAGGQDLYILRKPENTSELAFPEPSTETWWAPREKLNLKRPGKDLTLSYELHGQKQFRVFPSTDLQGSCSLEVHLEITCKETGKSLLKTRQRFNHNALFGESHSAVITVDMPPHTGPVTVRLRTATIGHTHGASSQKGIMTWRFPHFFDLPDPA